MTMIDFHNHLLPGVDDGSASLDETRAALRQMREQGISSLITTSHLDGDLTLRPEALEAALVPMDAAWERVRAMVAEEFPDLRIARGHEVMLNTPSPDLSDPRLRLAGTSFALVEFPYMKVPPNSADTVFQLKMKGWKPVIAHPERYGGIDQRMEIIGAWRRVGGLLQVNCGSLLGRYGGEAKAIAWRLLGRGWVDYLSSDFHARGRCNTAGARARLEEKGGAMQARLLTEINPARLLADEMPEPVPPLVPPKPGLWQRIWKR